MPEPAGFQIGFVSSQTGLSTHVIRAWERRYKAIQPQRSATGRRLFSKSDIERLLMLKQAVRKGHSISHIAGLEQAELIALTGAAAAPPGARPVDSATPSSTFIRETITDCLEAISILDGNAVYRILKQAAVACNRQVLLDAIFKPLMEVVGKRWSDGSGRIVHGHLAAGVVHAQLINMLEQSPGAEYKKPCLLIATPAGQCCYLGALSVAVIAHDHGWQPVFVGSNLPAEEIAAAHAMLAPQVVALSITCRVNDHFMLSELKRLCDLIDEQCPLVIGGRASHDYLERLELPRITQATARELIDRFL